MNRFATMTLTVAVAMLTVFAIAEEKSEKKPAGDGQDAMAAMMQNLAKYGTPDEHHAMLKPLAGTFATEGTFQMAPGAPPIVTSGTHSREWVLDGRFLLEESKAVMNGSPFGGLGMIGYDRFKNRFVFLWTDSMTTSVSLSYGEGDGKTFTYHAEYDDPFTGTTLKHRNVLKVIDEDHHTLEFFSIMPDKTEFRVGRMSFTRK